jgi:hypothetical protein
VEACVDENEEGGVTSFEPHVPPSPKFSFHAPCFLIFCVGHLKQPAPKMGIFGVGCLRQPIPKIDFILRASHLKQPTPKIPIFCAGCLKWPTPKMESHFW